MQLTLGASNSSSFLRLRRLILVHKASTPGTNNRFHYDLDLSGWIRFLIGIIYLHLAGREPYTPYIQGMYVCCGLDMPYTDWARRDCRTCVCVAVRSLPEFENSVSIAVLLVAHPPPTPSTYSSSRICSCLFS